MLILFLDSCGNITNLNNIGTGKENNTNNSEEMNDTKFTMGLGYYLQEDGTYAVSVGEANLIDEIIIPKRYNSIEVTAIAIEGFKGHAYLEKIVIPNSIKRIGKYAFSDCTSLISIIIPKSVISIGSYSFYGCKNLTSITFLGTKEEWNAIEKGKYWDRDIKSVVIYCSD